MKELASHLVLVQILLAALVAVPATASAVDADADAARQADVASRSPAVIPFDLAVTTHIFTTTPDGGLQRVVTKEVTNNQ